MPIPPYLWLKDDGGADIKGSVDVKDREGSNVRDAGWRLRLTRPTGSACFCRPVQAERRRAAGKSLYRLGRC